MTQTKYLILESGEVFAGKPFGAQGEAVGELVFNTLMTGYLHTLTDARYYGQMVVQTFPLLGNYGVIPEEVEGKKCYLNAFIAREICDEPSNFRCKGTLSDWLAEQGVVGICDLDTRRLTKVLRDHGAVRGIVTDSDVLTDEMRAKLQSYQITDALAHTLAQPDHLVNKDAKHRVVMVDLGVRADAAEQLYRRGCDVIVVNAEATAKQILAHKPDAIVYTTGAGDPAQASAVLAEMKKVLTHHIPTFAFGLGHQLLALAAGGTTKRLPYGHIGGQPVRDTADGKLFITAQTHGYVVDTLPQGAVLRYVNVNDHSCEGLDYTDNKAFSVQFTPSENGGPLATDFLYDRLIALTEEK